MLRKLRFEGDVPEELFDEQFRGEDVLQILKEEAVVKLFEAGRISSGYATSLLGMTRRDFLELLQKRGVPFARYTEEDWEKEQRTLREVEGKFLKEQRQEGKAD